MIPPFYYEGRTCCPNCKWSRRTSMRSLGRYRRHWARKHAKKRKPHSSVIPWVETHREDNG